MITNKEKNFVSAVVYVHNNESIVDSFCNTLYSVLNSNFDKFEMIFVNDGCIDNSIKKIKDFVDVNKSAVVSIINMSIYQGVELAMNAGVDLSIGDFVFEFDSIVADYGEDIIMGVYNHSLKGNDIVSASPQNNMHISSRIFYNIFNRFSGAKYNLRTDRFRILSRRAINRVRSISKTTLYRKAAYANSGLSIDSLFYKSTLKDDKCDKKTFQSRKQTAFDSLILFTDIAYKLSMMLTVTLLLFTLFSGGYSIIFFLGDKKPIEGWTTTMILLAGGFSGVFLILAIILKYLSILVELVLKKQKYLIDSVEKL